MTGIEFVDEWVSPSRKRRAAPVAYRSPLEAHLPWLNAVAAALLVLMGLASKPSSHRGLDWIGAGNLPAIVYVTVLVAKCLMGGVDPEGELSALKYNYKGA
ncbi:hypothetical protein CDD80_6985 [Ophiocordyceps camponoti-rufipedis]|uniref:Uncharacterized protein n=1 Tax=Ophiocordyceps camponoti-rufipedis TaxID=2004952 RepID=A0A2C5XE50_9HYPO|nr:hypothetical protein CDD80_6985 [Ophiocordyceps camponoti-rufipedis]